MPAAALNIISGITEYTSRIELKNVFGQFGEVTACWLPPMDHRERGAYVKFGSTRAAELAVAAAGAGRVYLDGMRLEVEWRQASNRTEDTRDFKAQGSNLMTSRDLMRAAMKERQSAKKQRETDVAAAKEAATEVAMVVTTAIGGGAAAAAAERKVGGEAGLENEEPQSEQGQAAGQVRGRAEGGSTGLRGQGGHVHTLCDLRRRGGSVARSWRLRNSTMGLGLGPICFL
eukprot:CAMPEP_0117528370 /NCGR_PEP_ID=MMETSP0784-20121206/37278_1 /TAXON_ID=39447 /ORGANISM="" /LENGTH=229 /DNA_ID=CAMNT_0005324651 /DNA_START=154 /DNA_END=841 /DNA_ORIENTATION=+